MKTPSAITIKGKHVTVLPLTRDLSRELYAIGQEPELWTFVSTNPFEQLADVERYIDRLLSAQSKGDRVPLAVRDNVSGRLAGATSYLHIDAMHCSIEIGGTWYGKEFRRTSVNTETKLLLLIHAFEYLRVNRVQFQTDSRNERSQHAIERIGAKKEGILRANKVYPSGYIRDSVVYSIVRDEWADVRRQLEQRLNRSA